MSSSNTDTRQERIEAAFREQYRELDDATLTEIASGQVPWVADGAYLFAARRAARSLLEARGVKDVPAIPAWDPASAEAPLWIRAAIASSAVLLVLALGFTWHVLAPPGAADLEAACAETRQALAGTELAGRHELTVTDCALEDDRGIAVDACITLTEPQLTTLAKTRDPVTQASLRRFAKAPTPGRHCARAVVADLVSPPGGRPWFVRLRG